MYTGWAKVAVTLLRALEAVTVTVKTPSATTVHAAYRHKKRKLQSASTKVYFGAFPLQTDISRIYTVM